MVPLLASSCTVLYIYCAYSETSTRECEAQEKKNNTHAKFNVFTELYELFEFLSEAVSGAACSLAIYTLERGLV